MAEKKWSEMLEMRRNQSTADDAKEHEEWDGGKGKTPSKEYIEKEWEYSGYEGGPDPRDKKKTYKMVEEYKDPETGRIGRIIRGGDWGGMPSRLTDDWPYDDEPTKDELILDREARSSKLKDDADVEASWDKVKEADPTVNVDELKEQGVNPQDYVDAIEAEKSYEKHNGHKRIGSILMQD